MTRSTGISGLTRLGSPPSRAIADAHRRQIDHAGHAGEVLHHHARRLERQLDRAPGSPHPSSPAGRTSSSVTAKPSTWRSSASSSTLMENGSREMWPMPASSSAARR